MNLRRAFFIILFATAFNLLNADRVFEYDININRLKEGYSVVESYYIKGMKYAELGRLINIATDSIKIDGVQYDYNKFMEKPEEVVNDKEFAAFYSTKDAHSLKKRMKYLEKIKSNGKKSDFNKSMIKLSYLTLTMTAFLSYYSTADITWFEDNTFYFFFAVLGFELVTFMFNTLFL
ncbi:MAG: hypothetical protein AB7V16_12275 [Vulcanibacillus sp.]